MTSGPGQPPPGYVVLTLVGSSVVTSAIRPKVTLNGHPVSTSYGENALPVPPGRWHVDVRYRALHTYGQAAIDVDVAPGQAVRVFYTQPWHQFATGSIGFEPQPRRGLGFLLLTAAVCLVAVGVIVALSL